MSIAASISISELQLSRFFLALIALLFSAHLFGYLFNSRKLPRVVGEIFGGFLLGPTVLAHFSPAAFTWVFNAFPEEGKLISLISWFGLVLLMFVSGFEIEKSFSTEDRRTVTAFVLGATTVPFLVGLTASYFSDLSALSGRTSNRLSVVLIVGIAVAVTSIPVISKIFIDLGILNTRFAKIVLAIATIEDIVLWALLAVATGLAASAGLSLTHIATTVLATVVFFGLGLLAFPRLLRFIAGSPFAFLLTTAPSKAAIFACFSFVAVASLLGINIVFGAFLAGVLVGTMPQIFDNAKRHTKAISLSLFTPIYFAVVGLKLDLIRQFDIPLFIGFLLFSTLLKASSVLVVGRLRRFDWLSSLNLSVALNARGGPGIVLATIAFDLGLISEPFFAALVLTAITTSLVAGLWFRYVLSKGWDLFFLPSRVQPRETNGWLGAFRRGRLPDVKGGIAGKE